MVKKFILPIDSFWLESEGNPLTIRIDREFLNKAIFNVENLQNDEFVVEAARGIKDDLEVIDTLETNKNEILAYNSISQFNQLGIKDYLLGLKSREKINLHTRQNHSFGTALIGRMYFNSLKPQIKYTFFNDIFKDRTEHFEKILSYALYLHDVGHLPFSHLIENVFNEINWTRIIGTSYRHDEVPIQQLSSTEQDAIKKAISDSLYGKGGNLSTEEMTDVFNCVQDLIAGICGIPFCDAIVNSSIDADKIDYIFRDMKYTENRARLRERDAWLTGFFSNISLSPEGLVRVNGDASLCVLELLEERQFLYSSLYMEPKIRVMEKIASVIITSWMTSKVSARLLDILPKPRITDNIFTLTPDTRKAKGDLGSKIILEEFLKNKSDHEINTLLNMCEELSKDQRRDEYSRNWFSDLGRRIGIFTKAESQLELTKSSNEMMVEEPIYIANGINKENLRKVVEIARSMYIDFPCSVLIDIIELPEFLPYPKARCYHKNGKRIIGETFLVPDEKPSLWSRSKVGRFPLHRCDFRSLQKDYSQVIMINTMPGEINGPYIYDLFIKRCNQAQIPIEFSIWR
jgi:HD superfamily phosphohydrolase